MDLQITGAEMRTAAGGAAVALVLGLMLGGAMHPNLAGDDRPAGPQIILGAAAERSTGPFDIRPEMASYSGRVPDYVLGTDWKRAASWQEPPAAVSPPALRVAHIDDTPSVVLTRATYDEDPPPPRRHGYPTLGDDLPTHAPVGQAVDDADDAPDAGR